MTEPTYDPRRSVRELLELFSSEDQQLAYERNVPFVDITAELICMWFDDTYRPPELWTEYFSTDELNALADFHRLYDLASRRLPKSLGTVRTWLADPIWRGVMEAAGLTLARIHT